MEKREIKHEPEIEAQIAEEYQLLQEYRLDEIIDRLNTLSYIQLCSIEEYINQIKKKRQYQEHEEK